jgi:hypothetical protein
MEVERQRQITRERIYANHSREFREKDEVERA